MSPGKIKTITLLLLAIGFGSALVIYLTAKPVVLDPLLGNPLTTKKFVHEMRVIGGKGNVLTAEIIDEFGSLWEGRALAGTVAVLTVVGTLAFRFVALRPEIYAPHAAPEEIPPS